MRTHPRSHETTKNSWDAYLVQVEWRGPTVGRLQRPGHLTAPGEPSIQERNAADAGDNKILMRGDRVWVDRCEPTRGGRVRRQRGVNGQRAGIVPGASHHEVEEGGRPTLVGLAPEAKSPTRHGPVVATGRRAADNGAGRPPTEGSEPHTSGIEVDRGPRQLHAAQGERRVAVAVRPQVRAAPSPLRVQAEPADTLTAREAPVAERRTVLGRRQQIDADGD